MPRWEYKSVRVQVISTDQMKENARNSVKAFRQDVDWIQRNRLDPDLVWENVPASPGETASRQRVGWSERGCWTPLSRCMEELGDQSWELVGVTPPLRYTQTDNVSFDLLFKRPKP